MASFSTILFSLVVAVVVHFFLKAVYRLTLHPLAKFPGPFFGRITNLYPMYYDFHPERSYIKEFPALHDKYGPIVRAWPNILHIRDIDAYHQVFKASTNFGKQQHSTPTPYTNPSVEHSYFNMSSVKEARVRRALYNPFFSKAAVHKLEHLIMEKVNHFCSKLSEAAKSGTPVDLNFGYSCLMADGIMHYAFGASPGALDFPGFKFPLIKSIEIYFDASIPQQYFPTIFNGINRIVTALPSYMTGPFESIANIKQACRQRIIELKEREKPSGEKPTMFDVALDPDPEKKYFRGNLTQLTDDALLVVVAGTDTTAHTLLQGTWAALANPEVYQKLKAELNKAMPTKDTQLSLNDLEALPYLRGFVKESLRFGYGVPGRIPREVPKEGATLCGQHIPPGTNVAHSAYVYHSDDNMFENAKQFKPERWLGKDAEALESRMISFSRGPRSCLGLNLANANLFFTIAYVFRRFELTPFETTAETMAWKDAFTSKPMGHMKVTLKEVAV